MTILGTLPVSPEAFGQLLRDNLILHQRLLDQKGGRA